MASPEIPSSHQEEKKERIHRSVRVFAVAPIRAEQLDGLLSTGKSPDEISFIEVILAQESGTNRVTAIGGEMNQGEDVLHAGMRKVFEKSLLTRESRRNLQYYFENRTPMPYRISGQRKQSEAFLTVMPIRSSAISLHDPREDNGEVYKIQRLVSVTPEELQQLFTSGFVDTQHWGALHIFGHLTQAKAGDVTFSADGRRIQDAELSRVIQEIRSYEQSLLAVTKEQINLVRRWHKKPMVTGLGQCGHEELRRGFLAAQMILGFTDERMRDSEQGIKPPKSTDLLTASLYTREFTPQELPDALVSMPTQEVRRVRNVLKYALRGTVVELYKRMDKDIRPYMAKKNLFPLHMRDVADFIRRKPTSLSYLSTLTALRAIWPQVVVLPLDQHTELLKHLDVRFIDELTMQLHKSPDVVKRALEFPEGLPHYIADEMQKTKNSFQQHYPINEVAGAIERPFVQMLHILGLHPYKNVPFHVENEAEKRTRGEMLMVMSAFFTSIQVIEQHMAADDSRFENGLARFLKYPPELDEIFLEDVTHTIYRRETEKTVGGKLNKLWYDKRPIKSEEREWFKALQEPVVRDNFSHNFVFLDDNFSEEERTNIPMRLDLVKEFREALLGHYRTELEGSGWQVSIVPGTLKTAVIDSVRKFITIQSRKEGEEFIAERMSGDHAGSVGKLIVRAKFVMSISRGGVEHLTEICIYPFQSINIDGTVLSGSGLMAFTEKLLDDMRGRYAGYRLIQTDADDPTGPSPIELYEPAAWSKSRFDEIKLFQHTPRKKKR
jgi:hypothetical protein